MKFQWLTSEKDDVHIYIYIYKEKKLQNIFIYKNPDTLQKERHFTLRFDIQNKDTLRYAIFHEIFEVGIYIQN